MIRPLGHLLDTVHDAAVAAWGQRVASVVSTLVVAGVTSTILATTGQTVASERQVLSEINSPAGRLVVLTDDEGGAQVEASSVAAIAELQGVEWVVGLGPAVDVTNAAVPGGPGIAARRIYGTWPSPLSTTSYRTPVVGDALLGPQAVERLGLLAPVGGISGASLGAPIVGGFTADDPLEDLNTSALVLAQAEPGARVRTITFSVDNVRDIDVVTRAAQSVLVANDGSQLSAARSENLVQLQQVVSSQLAANSRRLVWIALAAGMVLVTITQFGAVSQRARDYGRRRALGATRTGILVHVLVQAGICSVTEAACGALLGLAIDWRFAGALPGLTFTAAVGTLSVVAPLVASVPPAVRAAYRDPVRILRIP